MYKTRMVLWLMGMDVAAYAVAHTTDVPRGQIQTELRAFADDTRAFMHTLPKKWNEGGVPIPATMSRFSKALTDSREFVHAKSFFESGTRAPIELHDDPSDLVDSLTLKTLADIEAASLMRAQIGVQPWSGDYWPTYGGQTARRYADGSFPNSIRWTENLAYVTSTLGRASSMAELSPAEKYDVIVGDFGFTLTKQQLETGRQYVDSSGMVEAWMGICHGWAPASFMVPRPKKAIQVMSSDGHTLVPMYPDDIKALVTLLWAQAPFAQRFIGSRCDTSKTTEDPANGRTLEPECWDSNPGTFHLALVNQLGAAKKSFVMDATFDYQVWNQPITKYKYTYFNPATENQTSTLAGAKVRRANFTGDKFKKYRASNTESIVGIAMEVTYLNEIDAEPVNLDGPQRDNLDTVLYLYDLELDAQDRIIGGEWYQNAHPDFFWTPATGAEAKSVFDRRLEQDHPGLGWDGTSAVPPPWSAMAKQASRYGMPLAEIVRTLVALSRL